jgi:flagellar motor switch protein FliM
MVEKVLNQEQIDAMVRAARGGQQTATAKAREKRVTAWDARQAGQIGREQMRAISTLHESFARNLTHSLGAYLRVGFTAALVSAEHLTFGEFLQRLPEVTYLATSLLDPLAETALLQLDLSVAFPLVDVLLGGQGTGAPPQREITEIEEQILETVVHIICRELQTAWQALALGFQFGQRQQPDQVARLMSHDEKTLSLSFEITMPENRGTLNVMVPAVVSNALLRKITAGMAAVKPKMRRESDERLREKLLHCPFPLEVGMNSVAVPLRELAQLSPGGLLVLAKRVEEPAELVVAGKKMFKAAVARRGPMRAAQLLDRIAETATERKPSR